jgi:hypothetical protein
LSLLEPHVRRGGKEAARLASFPTVESIGRGRGGGVGFGRLRGGRLPEKAGRRASLALGGATDADLGGAGGAVAPMRRSSWKAAAPSSERMPVHRSRTTTLAMPGWISMA